MRGEFQRVVDQADQHLAQARGIADDELRAIGPDIDAAGETLLVGPRLQQRPYPLDQIVQVEGGLLELEPAGFEPREIEHVVEHAEQAAARLVERLGVARLGGIERARQQQLAHGDHRLHGGAKLVPDHGEQVRLGLVGRLGGVTRVALGP